MRHCPALLISAPASGQGKTTVTAAVARYHRNQGRKVRIFKTGPDFLDPMILQRASGQPVYQLDLWMNGEQDCKQRLYQAAGEAELILIEGAMGLFDGQPSSADLAECFAIPVLAVIDATAMAQTLGALAHGLAGFRPGLPFAGVIANHVASAAHGEMLAASLPIGLRYFGGLPHNEDISLPARHLGLVQAGEINDLERRIERAAEALQATGLDQLPAAVAFSPATPAPPANDLQGLRIAVARDRAFSFIYPANLDLLHALGAELHFFSPLKDSELPTADALYLPGGYPELHLRALAANTPLHASIRHHHNNGRPIVAECGGMLYLLESLTDVKGHAGKMLGLLPGRAGMRGRLTGLGMQVAPLPEGELRGHTFHHSHLETSLEPLCRARSPRADRPGEKVYRDGRLTASYLHLYFPSNPQACAGLFAA